MSKIVKSALKVFGIKSESDVAEVVDLETFLEGLAKLTGYDISFRAEEKEGSAVHYEIEGPDAEEFLGNSSNMLETLSHLSMRLLRKREGVANSPINEESDLKNFRVTFDSEGFRERKIEELKSIAEKARKKVIDAGGKPSYIPALSPSERKVIHTHLADIGEVTSESIGKGTFKRIRVKLLPDSKHRKRRPERSSRGRGDGRRGGGGRGRGGDGNRGNRSGGGNRGPRRDQPNFPSDHQPQQQSGGISFLNDPFGVGGNDKGNEVNGNVAKPDEVHQDVDDNIGNRLEPGEDRFDPKS